VQRSCNRCAALGFVGRLPHLSRIRVFCNVSDGLASIRMERKNIIYIYIYIYIKLRGRPPIWRGGGRIFVLSSRHYSGFPSPLRFSLRVAPLFPLRVRSYCTKTKIPFTKQMRFPPPHTVGGPLPLCTKPIVTDALFATHKGEHCSRSGGKSQRSKKAPCIRKSSKHKGGYSVCVPVWLSVKRTTMLENIKMFQSSFSFRCRLLFPLVHFC
jgi:hypothetical protein